MSHASQSRLAVRVLFSVLLLLVLASAASAEWKEKVLYSFQGSPDAATPQGGVIFDKQGNLYGAALGGPRYSQGTVFQVVPPAKKGGPWTESVLYVFQGKPVNDGQIPTGGLIIDAAGNLYGVTGYGGTGGCILLGISVGCGTVYEISPPTQQGGKWTETILYSFQGGKDGYFPWGTLVFDKAGNLYGSTYYGGGYGSCNSPYYQYCGTVFKLSPPKQQGGAWTEKVLYSFKGGTAGKQFGDGADPNGGLVFDSKGAIYGTTYFGGNEAGGCDGGVGGTGCGTVFKLTPPAKKGGAWTKETLYRFQDGSNDGSNPYAGATFDQSEDLFGTTVGGGNSGYGTVFELRKPPGRSRAWKEAVLYRFSDGNDGANPMAGLVSDAQGDFFGTAYRGGNGSQYGAAFRLRPPGGKRKTWSFSALYGFDNKLNGGQPGAELALDSLGNLYSTTQYGGTGQNCGYGACGVVFEISR